MKRQVIMILGMHRSGTSALAGLIMRLGVDSPKKMLGPSPNNSLGHFEPLDLYKIQDRLLESAGSNWKDFRPFSEAWLDSDAAGLFQVELTAFMDENYASSPLFFLKDPRICRLMGLWTRILDAQKMTPLYLLTHRNPVEVAKSLAKRDGLDVEYSYLLWLRHVLDAEISTRGARRSFTSYARIMDDWPAEVEKISVDLGIAWPRYDASNFSDIEGMIRPDLKIFSDTRLIRSAVFPKSLKDTLAVLDHWAAHGEQPSDYAFLDRIRREFDDSVPLFYPAVQMDHGTLTAERDAARTATEAAQAETGARADELAQMTAARDAAKAAAQDAQAKADERAKVLASVTAERDAAQTAAQAAQATATARAKALVTLTAERDAARTATEAAQAETGARADDLARVTAARDTARDALDAVTAERDLLSEKLGLAQSTLEQRRAELADALEELQDAEIGLEVARQEIAALAEKLAFAQGEVRGLHGTLRRSAVDMGRLQTRIIAASSERDAAHRLAQTAQDQAAAQAAAQAATLAAMTTERNTLRQSVTSALQLVRAETAARDNAQRAGMIALEAERKKVDQAQETALQNKALLEAQERQFNNMRSHLEQQLAQSNARVTALEQSTLWRITGPLRWIIQRARK